MKVEKFTVFKNFNFKTLNINVLLKATTIQKQSDNNIFTIESKKTKQVRNTKKLMFS